MAMPSGTATMAAMVKPPTTRHTVMPMSCRKPNSVNRSHPSWTIVTGLARKVGDTKPPSVNTAHVATNSTKKATPSTHLVRVLTGSSGRSRRRGSGTDSTNGDWAPRVRFIRRILEMAGW